MAELPPDASAPPIAEDPGAFGQYSEVPGDASMSMVPNVSLNYSASLTVQQQGVGGAAAAAPAQAYAPIAYPPPPPPGYPAAPNGAAYPLSPPQDPSAMAPAAAVTYVAAPQPQPTPQVVYMARGPEPGKPQQHANAYVVNAAQPGAVMLSPAGSLASPGSLPPGTLVMMPSNAVQQATTVISLPHWWPPHPIDVTCPGCKQKVTTRIGKETGMGTWLVAGGVCLLGCIPCCLIPFCVDACKDTLHTCPNCNRFLGMQKMV